MKKPQSVPKVPAAPAVPSFGAPILPLKPSAPAVSTAKTNVKTSTEKKRVSLFSLTPGDDVAEPEPEKSDTEEDVDEEAAYAANLSSGP